MGFVGLHTPMPELPFAPCMEIGWRLARPFWGQGLTTEAARLALRVGMRGCPDEAFDHPTVPKGDPVRAHCLYRLRRSDWRSMP